MSVQVDLVANPFQTVTYVVGGTDENGCQSTAEVSVFVRDAVDLCNIPSINVITPNGDGVNDALAFEGLGAFSESKLTIF